MFPPNVFVYFNRNSHWNFKLHILDNSLETALMVILGMIRNETYTVHPSSHLRKDDSKHLTLE